MLSSIIVADTTIVANSLQLLFASFKILRLLNWSFQGSRKCNVICLINFWVIYENDILILDNKRDGNWQLVERPLRTNCQFQKLKFNHTTWRNPKFSLEPRINNFRKCYVEKRLKYPEWVLWNFHFRSTLIIGQNKASRINRACFFW